MERHGAGRIDDFTDRAKRTLALAQDEAMRLDQSYIGTEHVLLGLVREDKGAAARALASLGVELSKARAAVELLIKRTPETGPAAWRTWPTWPMGETTGLVLSLPAKKAIGNAREEAHRLGRSNVGTEHLLLGLVREGGKALEVLQSLGVPGDKVRDQVIATLGEQGPEQATPEPAEPDLLDVDSANLLTYAREEAARRRHTYLGSEHLLLALRRHYSPVLKQVWAEFGPATEALGQNIDAAIAAGTGPGPYGGGMTPRLTRIVRRAHAIAKERGRGMVPPEYLFLALLDDGQDVAAQVLAALGVTAERLRQILDSPPD